MSDIYSGVFPPYKFAYGCRVKVDVVGGTNFPFISAGEVRDDSNALTMRVSSQIQLYGTLNGVNGLDTGVLQANKMYAVYVIGDPTGHLNPAGLMSLSQTDPVMPALEGITYGAKRLVGYVRTGASPVFTKSFATGNGLSRTVYYFQRNPANIALSFTFTNSGTRFVDLSTCMPTIDPAAPQMIAIISVVPTDGNAGDMLYISSNDENTGSITNSTLILAVTTDVVSQTNGEFEIPVVAANADTEDFSPGFALGAVVSSNLQGTINVIGFKFDI